jgi:putative aldouronate transport system permease protein
MKMERTTHRQIELAAQAQQAQAQAQIKRRPKAFFSELYRNKTLYLMFIPIVIYYVLFAYVPMLGIVVAFKEFDFKHKFFSPWNGLDNFQYFVKSGKMWLVTQNTLVYNTVFLVCYTVFSIAVAVLVAEMAGKWFKKLAQSLLFLPYFISWVTVASFVYNFFNYDYGFFNTLLKQLGASPIDIYSKAQYWYVILPVLYVWKWVGFGSILYLAAIMGIDQEIYEAATIDGANRFQKIFRITLPQLKPTIIILVLLGLGRVMRGEFDMFYQLIGNNGSLMDATDIIDTLAFRSLMGLQDFGMASAVGFYQSVLSFVIIMLANYAAKKIDRDYALF